jgi:hypothetical protein
MKMESLFDGKLEPIKMNKQMILLIDLNFIYISTFFSSFLNEFFWFFFFFDHFVYFIYSKIDNLIKFFVIQFSLELIFS